MEDTSYSDNGYPPRSARILTRIHLVINYLFCLLYGLIGLEILLDLAGASESSTFKQFLNALTHPFLGPFVGLFVDPVFRGHYRLRVSYMVALIVYALVHVATYGLIRLFEKRQTFW
jgi:uncharacterized protein YggT (Ycf19 family)